MTTFQVSPATFAELRAILHTKLGREAVANPQTLVLDMTGILLSSPLVQCPDCAAYLQVTGTAELTHIRHAT